MVGFFPTFDVAGFVPGFDFGVAAFFAGGVGAAFSDSALGVLALVFDFDDPEEGFEEDDDATGTVEGSASSCAFSLPLGEGFGPPLDFGLDDEDDASTPSTTCAG